MKIQISCDSSIGRGFSISWPWHYYPLPSFFPPISKKWITLPKFEYILNIFDPICGRGPDIPPPPPTHTNIQSLFLVCRKFYFRYIFYFSWRLVNESFPVLKILWYQMCRGSWYFYPSFIPFPWLLRFVLLDTFYNFYDIINEKNNP